MSEPLKEGLLPGVWTGLQHQGGAVMPLGPVGPGPQEAAVMWGALGRKDTAAEGGAVYPLSQPHRCCCAPLATSSGSPLSWAEGEQMQLRGQMETDLPRRGEEMGEGVLEKGTEWTVTVSRSV